MRIKAPFATAKKTAKVLGVSKSRFKVLARLASVSTIANGNASPKSNDAASHTGFPTRSAKILQRKSSKSWSKATLRNRKSKLK